MKYETIVCPFCGNGHAHITYEENRVYQMNCPDCHNAIFHRDTSWDSAVSFFKRMVVTDESALRQQEHFGEVNKALTLDELSERNAPVFLPIKDFPNGGYWCLCENGYIIPPSGHGFMAKERPNWVFYRQKPEEDDHEN